MREPRSTEAKVDEALKLARENNQMLKKMRRNAFLSGVLRIIWWAAILGVPVYLYFTVFQPYLAQLAETYQGIQGDVQGLQQIPQELQELLNNIPGFGFFGGGNE